METLASNGNLDLATRKGKRPGGYNMTLPESGVPFIFMNFERFELVSIDFNEFQLVSIVFNSFVWISNNFIQF